MAKDTGISWTNHTFNPWWGCTKVGNSPACDGCYAERTAKRWGFKIWGNEAPRRYFGDQHWNEPLKWNRAAEHAKQRKRVFCMSMGDWAEGRPEQREHLERLWELIQRTPWLDWLMLTKRPQLIPALYPASWQCDPLPNVWLGTTAETQAWLDLRWPLLKRAPAAVYWLSIEPLLEPITLPEDFLALGRQAWCIVGGESGPQAHPMSPDWARRLRDQCTAAGVPFHFKQWGEWSATTASSGRLVQIDTQLMLRVGKKKAGRVLDGREWDEVPTPVREGSLDSKESAVALPEANRVEPVAAGRGEMNANLLSAPKARFVAATGINGPAQPKPGPKHVEPPVAEPPAITPPVSRKELWRRCEPIATLPRILDRFAVDLRLSGVVGEERTAKLIYLALISRLFARPVSIAVKGPSSGGKSHTVQQVLKFFPADAYYDLTAMSERALAYSTEPVKHRFVVLYEAAGMKGQTASYLIRSLLSEGRIRYETVEKTSKGLHSKLIEREGPTGLITTTTLVGLHPENETRLLSVAVKDSPEQLARMIPPVAVRLRRDFGALCTLIKTHAFLHRASRERDAQHRTVATIEDYAAVRELVVDLISEGVNASVSATVRETVQAVAALQAESPGGVSLSKLTKALSIDKSAASRRVNDAESRGYLVNYEDQQGKPARLSLGEPLPEDMELLPPPEQLEECCSVA